MHTDATWKIVCECDFQLTYFSSRKAYFTFLVFFSHKIYQYFVKKCRNSRLSCRKNGFSSISQVLLNILFMNFCSILSLALSFVCSFVRSFFSIFSMSMFSLFVLRSSSGRSNQHPACSVWIHNNEEWATLELKNRTRTYGFTIAILRRRKLWLLVKITLFPWQKWWKRVP